VDKEKDSKPQGIFRPFKDLKTLLKNKSIKLAPSPDDNSGKSPAKTTTGPTGPPETANVTTPPKAFRS